MAITTFDGDPDEVLDNDTGIEQTSEGDLFVEGGSEEIFDEFSAEAQAVHMRGPRGGRTDEALVDGEENAPYDESETFGRIYTSKM